MQSLIRWIYHRLLPAGARNTLRLHLLLDRPDRPPELIRDFRAGSVLVLAPHMDDEVIGCGGVIRLHVLAGARVSVAFLTDGRRGNPGLYADKTLSRDLIAEAEAALVEVRKEESRKAAAVLGIQEMIFLDAADGELYAARTLIDALHKLMVRIVPDVIYLPSRLDSHPDHWATHDLFRSAISGGDSSSRSSPILREYEVWSPLWANRVADIESVFEVKLRALEQFASQNRWTNYLHTTRGLNAYRSIHGLRGQGHAEAFFESTPTEYLALLEHPGSCQR